MRLLLAVMARAWPLLRIRTTSRKMTPMLMEMMAMW
jgi:hypothetical protein